jgi:ubiquinone/menaquinone biosynthesis C-methylase UbiE
MSRETSTKFVIDPEFEKRASNTFYDNFYSKATASEVLRRDFMAKEKYESILKLCNGFNFEKVVEVGCGYGNILSLLDKSKFAPELYGLEVSPSVVRYLEEKTRIPSLKAVYLLDTSNTPFEDDFFDLGILSHVLEHVPDPKKLLKETLRTCKYVHVEVPLEDCLVSNMFASYQLRFNHQRRIDNISGHINFFNKSTAVDLFSESGSEILRERTYRSWKLFSTGFQPAALLKSLQSILFYLIFRVTKSAIVVSNYAVLLRKRSI